jgi:integrase
LEKELRSFFSKHPGVPRAPMFPTLASVGTGGRHGLSGQFANIMTKAGIQGKKTQHAQGGHVLSNLSFHSLRHSFNSALANKGVPQELRQRLSGHASAEMNKLYTHHEIETLRQAIALIPGVK